MQTYVVTGSNRGLGLEFVRQLRLLESAVIFAGIRSFLSDCEALKALTRKYQNIHLLECDVSLETSINTFTAKVMSVVGSHGKIYYLINNAGINLTPHENSTTLEQENFTKHMIVNVLGPVSLTRYFRTHLQADSVVLNMGSDLGSLQRSKAMEETRSISYSISKAVLSILTLHQASELRDTGADVIFMDPGLVRTDMGGADAILDAESSVKQMLQTLWALRGGDSGSFYMYGGQKSPW